MSKKIFVNLPVKNLDKSVAFFKTLGYTFNPKFTDENAICMIVDDNIFVMLLVEKHFRTFTPKPVADAKAATEVILGLSMDDREKMDAHVRSAVAAGGTTPNEAKDYGFM